MSLQGLRNGEILKVSVSLTTMWFRSTYPLNHYQINCFVDKLNVLQCPQITVTNNYTQRQNMN